MTDWQKYKDFVFKVDDQKLDEIAILAGKGLTINQICAYYGITYTTWLKRTYEHPELKLAFKMGKVKMISSVSGELIKRIKGGNVPATIFYLKTQAGWKETSDVDIDPDDEIAKKDLKIDTNDPIEAAKIYQQIMLGDIT